MLSGTVDRGALGVEPMISVVRTVFTTTHVYNCHDAIASERCLFSNDYKYLREAAKVRCVPSLHVFQVADASLNFFRVT